MDQRPPLRRPAALLPQAAALSVFVCLAACSTAQTADAEEDPEQENPWVLEEQDEPSEERPMSTQRFYSPTIGGEVTYTIYLPPQYGQNEEERFPVVYFLHGLNGTAAGANAFARRLDEALAEGKAIPMIWVGVMGTSHSMFCDSKDGSLPVETVIVRDLVPHIDSMYRTIPEADYRGLEGFSMGGFGAAHLGFKYPEMFGVVSTLCAALHTEETLRNRRNNIFEEIFGGDAEYCRQNTPWTLAEKNADVLRENSKIRVYCGSEEFLKEWNQQFSNRLKALGIPHEFKIVQGASHNPREIYDLLDHNPFAFYREAFGATPEP